MSLLTLQPTILAPGGANPSSLTAALAAGALGANTGVLFENTLHDLVVVQVGTTATVITSQIGTEIEGQSPPGVPSGTLAANGLYIFGLYPSDYDRQDGTLDVELDFSVSTGVSVAVLRPHGVA
jgi:hypothetical protein